jgi:hypothetical protein
MLGNRLRLWRRLGPAGTSNCRPLAVCSIALGPDPATMLARRSRRLPNEGGAAPVYRRASVLPVRATRGYSSAG